MKRATTVVALAMLALFALHATAQAPAAKAPPPQAPAASADGLRATGVLPITAETSLVIRGVPGQIVVTTKPARELRFKSIAKDRSGGPRPLAVTVSGTTVTMSPAPGGTLGEGTLRVEAPASFSVRVEAENGTVAVDGFSGAVEIVSKTTAVRAQALTGPLKANVEAGSLALSNLAGAVTAKISAKAALTSTGLRGALDLNSQDASFKVQGVGGACRVEAKGGSAELSGLAMGCDLHLSETPLRLIDGKGDLTVVTDAAVTLGTMAGSIRLDMDGGSLRGQSIQGPVTVRAQRTDVVLQGITGDLDLDVTRGKVAVSRATGSVNARVFAGDAKLLELQGPLRLDMDGGSAEVSFTAVAGDRDSEVNNNGGDVTVRFPGNASCRVKAKARSGKITSELPTIKTPADATEASGSLGQGKGPLISIEADGNIHLAGGGAAAPPAATPAPTPVPPS